MDYFVGLDVSLRSCTLCVVDTKGKVLLERELVCEVNDIAACLCDFEFPIERIGLEAGTMSQHLYFGLQAAGFDVVCMEARQVKAALSAMRNKTDKNDAKGIAHVLRTGWFSPAHMKSREAHGLRALLSTRKALLKKTMDLELDRRVKRAARHDEVCLRLMTVPGVGPIAALTFKAAVDDPTRFKKSRTVGAHFGLTPRRFQSGEHDNPGRISKAGDSDVRAALYAASNALLMHSMAQSQIKSWDMRLMRTKGRRRAVVAVARKLAVSLHRMWVDCTEFRQEQVGSTA